jgi:hypothetical protein
MTASTSLILNALRELGPGQLGLYVFYQLGLRSGYYRWATRAAPDAAPGRISLEWLPLPDQEVLGRLLDESGVSHILGEASEILAGKVRLFGGEPVPLVLTLPGPLTHWTEVSHGLPKNEEGEPTDVKFIWEPGRFGWAYTLGRAYHLSADERYPQAFWSYTERFLDSNPPYRGPHWASGQETALRLIALVFALRIFARSHHTTPQRMERLASAIAAHAERIPPTLIYARAQNNNHLLSEATGLYTAGLALPEHPSASRWRSLGWLWFNRGIQTQVASDGVYGQHSTNYQRLMLQLALWMGMLAGNQDQSFPEATRGRLAAATRWLCALLDPHSGRVPNLGPNDGAYILPLTVQSFDDYRSIAQAASLVFLESSFIEPGSWDEMALWLAGEEVLTRDQTPSFDSASPVEISQTPSVIRLRNHPSWAYLRAAHFHGRPGHADQLHLDLWWRGLNIAKDAGTYLYNAPPPWDNALTCTQVHNTLTVNNQEQMQRAGRFLYLRRAQAQVVGHDRGKNSDWFRLTARHDGYRRLGLIHQRSVTGYEGGRWLVLDSLLPAVETAAAAGNAPVEVCLHWLMPDWDWQIDDGDSWNVNLSLNSPLGPLRLVLSLSDQGQANSDLPKLQLARAGELVYGNGDVAPIFGWSSPTYGDKIPALAIRWMVTNIPPILLSSEWIFP